MTDKFAFFVDSGYTYTVMKNQAFITKHLCTWVSRMGYPTGVLLGQVI